MLVIAGGDVVLPDRILVGASLVVEGGRIASVEESPRVDLPGAAIVAAGGCYVVPGFIDVHVHGVEGHDTLDEGEPVSQIAARLPRYGVTAFCPTTVACPPEALRGVLSQVAMQRVRSTSAGARVLPAHLESNFINPEYRGAQPADCLRLPRKLPLQSTVPRAGDFSGEEILEVIAGARKEVGIVTLAPELPGGIDLIHELVAAGHRVSLGHSAASLDEAMAAIDAGASHATHLFNRMAPITHRAPGLAGAVLASENVAAELICDGYHVHAAMCRIAIASKGVTRVMAITDGTAGSGLPVGATARLGGRRIRVTDRAAVLDEGTLAGSTLTMDGAFRTIVEGFGLSVSDASVLCSTTPARQLGLTEFGLLAAGKYADLVVLNRRFHVVRTFVNGEEVYRSGTTA